MRNISSIFLGLALTGLLSCSPESEQIIMTILGPIPASAMGITLSHEHILVDFIGADSTAYHRWEKQEVVNKVIPYLEEIQECQVSTLMECTPAYLGSLEGNIRAAKMGTWISLDNLNLDQQQGSKYDVAWYADRIQDLKEAGFLNRVLISHDAGWYKPGEENGGSFREFTGIFTALVPALREVGLSQEDINLLLEINPRNTFSIRI